MRFGIILVVCAFFVCGCQQQAPVAGGKVYPSAVYLQHFGEPPVPQEGHAYAQVGYLPLADQSGQVLPIPLFLFTEDQQLDRILSQLFSDKMNFSARSQVALPFAQGLRLTQLDQAGDTLLVSLTEVDGAANVDRSGLERAIAETAVQFEEVSRVRILYDGKPSSIQPLEGYQHRPETIAAVPLPTLLDIVGIWEAGAALCEEIQINFNRPVAVNSFRLLDASGEQIGGKYFMSMFDMAIIVRPEPPEQITAGMTLNITWDANDQLGRRNSALDTFTLKRTEH